MYVDDYLRVYGTRKLTYKFTIMIINAFTCTNIRPHIPPPQFKVNFGIAFWRYYFSQLLCRNVKKETPSTRESADLPINAYKIWTSNVINESLNVIEHVNLVVHTDGGRT